MNTSTTTPAVDAETAAIATPMAARIDLLRASGFFAGAMDEGLALLAAGAIDVRFPAGRVVVDEQTPDDRLFILVEGRLAVEAAGPAGPIRIATLESGAVLGEIVPPMPSSRRDARVGTETDVRVLRIDAALFRRFLATTAETLDAFAVSAEDRLEGAFLGSGGHFARLDHDRLPELTRQLSPRTVAAGEEIVRAGETGDASYLLRAGVVEWSVSDPAEVSGSPVRLGPGAIFGEEAVLTDGPYAATVRAVAACDLLVLHRDDFLSLLVAEPRLRADLVEAFRFRDRPRQASGIIVHRRTEGDGRAIWILKDPHRAAYYRLTAHGWFLWQHLDGRHTIRDLTLAYLAQFKAFAPGLVAGEVAELVAAGFAVQRPLRRELTAIAPSGLDRLQRALTPIVEYRVRLQATAALVDRLYAGGARFLFTTTGQIAVATVALGGLAIFFLGGARQAMAGAGGLSLLVLIPLALFAIIWHELGHAFAIKAFGREVRLGVGWYWFGPLLYVDASDMWLSGKWPRIAVSIAGPYASLLLGSLAALAAWFLPAMSATGVLWLFAFLSYVWVILNLDPLLEYDGYYVLADLLDRPNLRAEALRWLGTDFVPTLHQRSIRGLRGHGVDLAYGVSALAYVGFIGFTTIVTYRLLVQNWVADLVSMGAAIWIGWVLSALAIAAMAATVGGELRGHRSLLVARNL